MLNLDEQGQPLTFRSALAGRFGDQWRRGNGDELLKLVETSRALTPVHHATSPPTYLNNVVKEKWSPAALLRPGHLRDITSDVDRRVRGTAGGDRLSVDITDYYLGTPNPNPPFIKVYTDQYPPEVLLRLRLSPFTKKDRRTGRPYVLFRADKTIYGLKESGKLSNNRLVPLLHKFGFVETPTPCLFRHLTRPITFVLVVDDFGVKYQNRDDFDYLVHALSSCYHVKAHPLAHKFLGFTIQHDRTARTLALSYPGYIDALLARLRPQGIKPCSTPSIYTPPRFGSTLPQVPTVDTEPLASAAQRKELQVAVGYLLYYGRTVDARILPATCALASEQATASLGTL